MFTQADICGIAVQIERNGEAIYRRAGKAAADSKIAEVFHWMAKEEGRHAQYFASLAPDRPLSPEELEIETMGRSLLQEMIRDKTFSLDQESLNRVDNLSELLHHSKVFEQDTILFYQFLRDIVDDLGTKRLLGVIIEEENRHVQLLTQMEDNELEDDPFASPRGNRQP